MADPLIVIVGETASGKSALAMDLALTFNGELICADSRTVYTDMNIGTAKPTAHDQAMVAHHLLDITTPDTYFNAAQFKELATRAMADITQRHKLPIMVGGTGLYIDSVLYGYSFPKKASSAERARLQALSVEELQAEIIAKGFPLPENRANKRHLTRLLEIDNVKGTRRELRENTLIIGLRIDKNVLRHRIENRVDAMLAEGFVEEVMHLQDRYGKDAPGLLATGYKPFSEYVQGHITIQEARSLFIKNDVALAKRQTTWFKRNSSIQWIDDPSLVDDIVTTFLNKIR